MTMNITEHVKKKHGNYHEHMKQNMEITTYVRVLFILHYPGMNFSPFQVKGFYVHLEERVFIHPEAAQNWTVAARQALMI